MKKELLIGFVVGFSIYSFFQRKREQPPVYYVKNIPFGFNALVLPPFGVFINEEHKNNENLIAHELIHWKQFKENGLILFLLKFFYHQITKGYDANPMEIEARFNETDFCKQNYTYCVRNGIAKTVSNPNFRR